MYSNALTQTSQQDSLFLTQVHLRNQLREAEEARETGLNERITSLEERLQSILQSNQQIEAELNQARTVYEERQRSNALSNQSLLDEIRPLENQVDQLTPAIATLVETNAALCTKVEDTRVMNERIKSICAQVDSVTRWVILKRAAFIKQQLIIQSGLDKAL